MTIQFSPLPPAWSRGDSLGSRAPTRPLGRRTGVQHAEGESPRWCVNTEDFNEGGRVYLELAHATPAEAVRGMARLTKLVG